MMVRNVPLISVILKQENVSTEKLEQENAQEILAKLPIIALHGDYV
jgi:hypothetical protein